MNEELMITKEDLVNWLNRPPSNDDLDLIGFITTRLENFYKLEQENKQLKEENKELNKVCKLYGQSLYNADLTKMKSILTELEEWLKRHINSYEERIKLGKGYELTLVMQTHLQCDKNT